MPPMATRRQMLRLLSLAGAAALAAACNQPASAPPAKSSTAAPAPANQSTTAAPPADAEWTQLVEAAKKEGVVTIATYAGTGYRRVADDFEAAFPGIKVEQTAFQSSSRDYLPRLFQERQANLFLWDLAFVPSSEMLLQARPQGAIDRVRPLIMQRPDILDDKNWLDGFESGFLDDEKAWSYGITRSRSQALWVNTDAVKEGEIKSYKDLLDPKWRGKIIAGDLRTKGSGYWPATVLRVKTGNDELIKQIFKDQEAVLSTDARQLTEFVVRGRQPIGFGAISRPILNDFIAEGLGKNLKPIPTVEIDYVNSSSNVIHAINKAPHPNAMKLFLNWVLTKEGGASWSKNLQDNARRADVPVFDVDLQPEKGLEYVKIDAENMIEPILQTQKLAKEALG